MVMVGDGSCGTGGGRGVMTTMFMRERSGLGSGDVAGDGLTTWKIVMATDFRYANRLKLFRVLFIQP